MKRSRLPLTALRSFEVAGRLQSFTLAAEELLISQAAVSRQVRDLESLLGRPLFERHHRRVSLTPTGKQMLSVLTRSFDDIAASLEDACGDRNAVTVTISAEPSFASAWLARHLPDFHLQSPGVDLLLDANSRLIDFRSAGSTIAVRHSLERSSWHRAESRHLWDVKLIPVAAPVLVGQRGTLLHPSDLSHLPLLHEESRDYWQRWFAVAGIKTAFQRGTIYTDGGLVFQAALRGEGVALVDELFARDDLKAGKLVQPFDHSISCGAYWLVVRRFDDLPEAAAAFVLWLEAKLNGT